MNSKTCLALLAIGSLVACNTVHEQSASVDPGMGEATKYNMAVQTIDPDPVYSAEGAQPGDAGDKGAAAVKRYRTDAVKAVQAQSTASAAGGGGGQ
jgi:hypothetical protein